jgi:UDP-N-acetylmuramate: L-alanyl-gamma-D-glutamyl-meso-diaminopimelate ligase
LQLQKAHFIGIAGVGMSATAKLLKDKGIAISGSDEDAYPPVSDFLEQEGISYNSRYAADNIPRNADLIVIGKNAKLVPETNPEVAAAYASGTRIASFPEVIGDISRGKTTIVVAGSFGKSTCAAILAHALECVADGNEERRPSFLIGAIPITPRTSARLAGQTFVIEGDEYPSSNTDSRSKFLHYHASHLLITPLAHDHINVFPTPEDYLEPFHKLLGALPARATVVACVEGSLSERVLSKLDRPIVTYGLHAGDFTAADIVWGEETRFTLMHRQAPVAALATTQLGGHNIQNIIGVSALLLSLELCPTDRLPACIATFRGLKRRLDRKSEGTAVPIFEGFGSSYDKARSAIAAMRRHFPEHRIVVLFEPHTFSWRNRDTLHWYNDVFSGTGKVFIYQPPSQGAATHSQVSQDEIMERVRKSGVEVAAITDIDATCREIESELNPKDLILILTSGNLGGLIGRVQGIAERKFPRMASPPGPS